MALQGADLIVLPTNWPPGATNAAACVPQCRSMENNVYYMAVNRIGTERGFDFIGNSRICDPDGMPLAESLHANEAILYADVVPEKARRKHLVRIPKQHEIHRFDDRRPDMYGEISRRD